MQLSLPRHHSIRSVLRSGPETPAPAPHPGSYLHARAQRSGGPDDRALYSCSCGCAFKAPVTTTVGCPHCGLTQAW
jgi:hypothetical protein